MRINSISFKGNLLITKGKSTPEKTARNFNSAIAILERSRDLAVKSQEYVESKEVMQKIANLPGDSTIEFQNLRLRNGIADTMFLQTQKPCLIYYPPKDSFEYLSKEANGSQFDYFEFELSEKGRLNSKQANRWLDSLV